MDFGLISTRPCENTVPPPDPRCSDPAFAQQNPDICPLAPILIIKPGIALCCTLGSIQFRAFTVIGDVETDVTDQAIFSSSDMSIAVVGAGTGNASATGLSPGEATISATYQGMMAHTSLTVLAGDNCCNNTHVALTVLVDTSLSMSQNFSVDYPTKLAYAKAAALRFIGEINTQKDLVGLDSFNSDTVLTLATPTSAAGTVASLVSTIVQTQSDTAFFNALQQAIGELNDTTANLRVLFLITDGLATASEPNSPYALLSDFKAQGGVVMCLGVRAGEAGFSVLENFATPGFFINAYGATAQAALDFMSGLKGYVCAGNCTPAGDVIAHKGALNYSGFINWTVTDGSVDLQGNGFFDYLPGNGLYVDLISGLNDTPPFNGRLVSTNPFPLSSGHRYQLTVSLAGNQVVARPADTVAIQIYWLNGTSKVYLLNQQVNVSDFKQGFTDYSFAFVSNDSPDVYIAIQQLDVPVEAPISGVLLGRVTFEDLTPTVLTVELKNTHPPPLAQFASVAVRTVPNKIATGLSVGSSFEISGASSSFLNGTFTVGTVSQPSAFTYLVPNYAPATFTEIATLIIAGAPVTLLDDNFDDENPVYVPPRCGMGTYYQPLYGYSYGYNCYGEGCLDSPPPAQLVDPNPQTDIESGDAPGPVTYESTQTQSATCGGASAALVGCTDYGPPTTCTSVESTTTNFGSGIFLFQYKLFAAQVALTYRLTRQPSSGTGPPAAWDFQGSNDGTTWTTIDSQSAQTFASGETKIFNVSTTISYLYYRITSTTGAPSETLFQIYLSGTAPQQAFGTASATSSISQTDADNKAKAAALAIAQSKLNCTPVFTSTKSFTAKCPEGVTGSPNEFTASATATSIVSQADADDRARRAAQDIAEGQIVCGGSINEDPIFIHDYSGSGPPEPASPYPSYKQVSGLTGVVASITVDLNDFSHSWPSDVCIVLKSPAGTTCVLMANCGNGGFAVSDIDITFQDGQPALPASGLITTGSYSPTTHGIFADVPAPGPVSPYGAALSVFAGENPNGYWSLWVCDEETPNDGLINLGWDINIVTA